MARLTIIHPQPKQEVPKYSIRTLVSSDSGIPTTYASISDIQAFLIGEKIIKHGEPIDDELLLLINDTHRRDNTRR